MRSCPAVPTVVLSGHMGRLTLLRCVALLAALGTASVCGAVPIQLWCPWTAGESWIAGGAGSFYGEGYHTGNDYYAVDFNKTGGATADDGAPILAAADGTIAEIRESTSYGWLVRINHANECQTLYAHLKFDPRVDPGVSVGQSVPHGTCIGKCGTTGWSTGTHLHFCLYQNGSSVAPDPMSGQSLSDGAVLTSDNVGGGGDSTQPNAPTLKWPANNSRFRDDENVPMAWNWSSNDPGNFRYQRVIKNKNDPGCPWDRWPNPAEHWDSADWTPAHTKTGEWEWWVEVWSADGSKHAESVRRTFYVSRGDYSAKRIVQNWVSADISVGQSKYFHVAYENTGTATWYRGKVFLGTSNPRDRIPGFIREDKPGGNPSGWKSGNRVWLAEDKVLPGQHGHFNFWMTVPLNWNVGATQVEYFEPVADGVCWMDGARCSFTVRVKDRRDAYKFKYKGQGPMNAGVVYRGQVLDMWTAWQNTGTAAWYQTGRYHIRLGMVTHKTTGNWVLNHTSLFSPVSGSSMLNNRRVLLEETKVAPGAIGHWRWQIRVPTNMSLGKHRYYTAFVSDAGDGLDFWRDEWEYNAWWEFDVKADTTPPAKATITCTPTTAVVGNQVKIAVSTTDTQSGVFRGRIAINRAADGSESGSWFYAELANFRGSATYNWNTTGWAVGVHAVRLECWDGAGNLQRDPVVKCTLIPGDSVPTVVITQPTDGSTTPRLGITVTGTASDDGQVVAVEVRVNGDRWKPARGIANWSRWLPLTLGENLIEARAQDDAGQWSNVASVSVVCDTPPTVTITAPADGLMTSQDSILVQGTAVDNGAVMMSKVRVNDGPWLTANGTTTWERSVDLPPGVNRIGAKARDDRGRWSAPAFVTVRSVPRSQSTLAWAGINAYEVDGVDPDSGEVGSNFRFKVLYTGPAPDMVRLHLYLNGAQIAGSPFAMVPGLGTPDTGQMFYLNRRLREAGTWAYRFSAKSGGVWATGEPTARKTGPAISAKASVVITSLACAPTAVGAQLSFTLSAQGAVTAEVLNIAGRPVRLLVQDRELPAGLNTLAWDGRSAVGLAVPSGLYLVRVTANGEGGSHTQAIGTVQLRR